MLLYPSSPYDDLDRRICRSDAFDRRPIGCWDTMKAKKPAKKATTSKPDPKFARVVDALAEEPGVSYGGKGFGSAALKVNDKIFAMMSSQGKFVVKLPKARVSVLVEAGRGDYFDPGRGRLMKEWLVAGAGAGWLALAKEALAFVRGPKP
jgi:hypothetical protein